MRKEYDFSKGERGKFYGKVDIENPLIIEDDVDESDFEKKDNHEQTQTDTNKNSEPIAYDPINH